MNPPKIGKKTETRISYDYSNAQRRLPLRGRVVPLPPPSQLPQTFNKLQDFRLDVRHRLNGRLAATLQYVYEPSKIFDFAFDPSVIDSIVQSSP